MLYDGLTGTLRVLVVAVLAYACLLFVLRVVGKRSLAKLNAFDFAVTVAFGSTLATVILNRDVALAEAVGAFAALAVLQWAVSRLSIAWPRFARIVRNRPALLFEDGAYLDEAMAEERITRGEVDAAIRKSGFARRGDVGAVVLETDGSMSVLPRADDCDVLSEVMRRPG